MKVKKIYQKLMVANLFLFSTLFFSCAGNNATDETANNMDTVSTTVITFTKAEAVLNGTYGDTTLTGTATFTEDSGKVKMELQINVPAKANQSVAVHIHETGDCADTGMAAHGHWNPTNKQHGKWGEGEFHSGDIGNVPLDANGNGTLTMETDLWSIGGDSTTNILDRAIIVHGGVDDFTSQPSGNAGTRIGCGVIKGM